jgi:hypothetical protein
MPARMPASPWLLSVALLLVSVAACGGASVSSPPAPRFIEGGGLGDGPITVGLNVYVADDITRKPVSGASVRVGGSADPAACMGTTDSTGLAVFATPACTILGGKQSVTASAGSYSPTTWIGVNAANITMTIRPTAATLAIDSAVVTGTITGWDALPAPAMNHNTLGIVGPSSTPNLDDAVNNLPQDTRNITVTVGEAMAQYPVASNVCIRTAYANDCSWRLKTRTGAQAHYAVVVDQDTKGTEADTDDSFTVIGWAIKRGLHFAKDQGADGEALTLIADADMQPFNVTFPSPPPGIDFLQAFPILQLGDEGRIAIVLPALDATHLMTRVPKLTGAFSDAKYDLLAKVQDAKDKAQPSTLTWSHAIDATKAVSAPSWLALPTGLTATGGTYSFTPVAGATVQGGELQTIAGKRAWSITIFDDTTSFTLPGVSPDPLPAGASLFAVSAIVAPGFKPNDVKFDDLTNLLTQISSDQIMFTH